MYIYIYDGLCTDIPDPGVAYLYLVDTYLLYMHRRVMGVSPQISSSRNRLPQRSVNSYPGLKSLQPYA